LSKDEDYKALKGMAGTDVSVSVSDNGVSRSENSWAVDISNTGSKLAFFVRAQLLKDGEELLPSYWSANYISLLPAEGTKIKVSCPVEEMKTGKLSLRISGWNVKEQVITLSR
jgi:hypothetical protein